MQAATRLAVVLPELWRRGALIPGLPLQQQQWAAFLAPAWPPCTPHQPRNDEVAPTPPPPRKELVAVAAAPTSLAARLLEGLHK